MVLDRLQRTLEVFTAFLFLNLLWLIFSLPIITIYPSTVTMFSIIRKWKMDGIDYSVGRLFTSEFKENFRKYFLLGILWLGVGLILLTDYYFLLKISIAGKGILLGFLFLSSFLYIGMSIYIFPITVNFELTKRSIIKNSFLYTVGRVGTTLSTIMILISLSIIGYYFIYLFWIIGSLTAFLIYATIIHLNRVTWTKMES